MGHTHGLALNKDSPFLIRDIKWAVRNGSLLNFWADSLGFRSAIESVFFVPTKHGHIVEYSFFFFLFLKSTVEYSTIIER